MDERRPFAYRMDTWTVPGRGTVPYLQETGWGLVTRGRDSTCKSQNTHSFNRGLCVWGVYTTGGWEQLPQDPYTARTGDKGPRKEWMKEQLVTMNVDPKQRKHDAIHASMTRCKLHVVPRLPFCTSQKVPFIRSKATTKGGGKQADRCRLCNMQLRVLNELLPPQSDVRDVPLVGHGLPADPNLISSVRRRTHQLRKSTSPFRIAPFLFESSGEDSPTRFPGWG